MPETGIQTWYIAEYKLCECEIHGEECESWNPFNLSQPCNTREEADKLLAECAHNWPQHSWRLAVSKHLYSPLKSTTVTPNDALTDESIVAFLDDEL